MTTIREIIFHRRINHSGLGIMLMLLFSATRADAFDLHQFEVALQENDSHMGRQTSISTLESMTPPPVETIPLLTRYLASDPSEMVRRQAAQTLGTLISGIRSEEIGVRKVDVHKLSDSVAHLNAHGKAAVEALAVVIKKDSNRGVRMEAIDALMRIRPTTELVLPSYLWLLKHDDFFRIRRLAADAIRLYGPLASNTENAIRELLPHEPEARVRKPLLQCLESFGGPSSATRQTLVWLKEHDPDWAIRVLSAKILKVDITEEDRVIGKYPETPGDLALLLKVVRSTSPGPGEPFVAEESYWGTRDRARALERLSRPASTDLKEAYLALLDDPDSSVRTVSAVAQAKLGDKRAIRKIRPLLTAEIRNSADSKAPVMGLNGIFMAQSLMSLNDCTSVKEIVEADKFLPMLHLVLTSCKQEALPFVEKRSQESGIAGQYAKGMLKFLGGGATPPK